MKNCTNPDVLFEYIAQPPLNVRLQLLAKDDTVSHGPWKGAPLGENRMYKAWARIPAQDKDLERKLGYR